MFDTFIEYYVRFTALTVTSYWGAVFWIIIGSYGLVWLYKQREDKRQLRSGMYYQGWVGAVGMIIVGISIIILKLLDKV